MESATEVRYAGVVVGRGAALRDRDEAGAFVSLAEPLPVGTPLSLRIDEGDWAARVTEVVESADPNLAGMRVRFVSRAEATLRTAPAPVAPPAPPPLPVDAVGETSQASVAPPAAAEAPPVVESAAAAPAVEVVETAPAAAEGASTENGVPTTVEGETAESGQTGSTPAGTGRRRRRRR